MNKQEAWKNFNLGQELSISGTFIYNGLRRFHEMQVLDNTDEIFEFLYNLSIGFERLLKVAVVFLEQKDDTVQDALEKSLITHNHLELLQRVRQHCKLNLASPHNEFLSLLGTFYKSLRYDRFTLSSVYDLDLERKTLFDFLSKHLKVDLKQSPGFSATQNDTRYRKYIRKIVTKISSALFEVVREKALELNLYTYELRHGSRAETIFLGQADLPAEEVLWKELLVFFMNTESTSGYLEFLRSIEPLEFDPELAGDYLQCFQSDAAKAVVLGELDELYREIEKPGERREMMRVIGNINVYFDPLDSDDEDEELL
ncbi:MAG: hypothetical protein JW836_09625 [Deltaproteobacteria bacterium]|nr:hypothetical protein [Deltaproteobacteria bacterium]